MKAAPDSFLKTLGEYLQAQTADQSANQPALLGTIDSGYTTGLPRVKFDGETVTSDKVFAIANGYSPVANDRVVLIPVGTTYMIIAKVLTSYTPPTTPGPATTTYEADQFTSTITMNTTTQQSLVGTINVTTTKANVQGIMIGSCDVEISGTNGDIFEATAMVDGGARNGKIHAQQTGVRVNASRAWAFTLASAGAHTFAIQAFKVNNNGTVVTYQNHTGIAVILGDM